MISLMFRHISCVRWVITITYNLLGTLNSAYGGGHGIGTLNDFGASSASIFGLLEGRNPGRLPGANPNILGSSITVIFLLQIHFVRAAFLRHF